MVLDQISNEMEYSTTFNQLYELNLMKWNGMTAANSCGLLSFIQTFG